MQDKDKYASYRRSQEDAEKTKVKRPVGNKKAKQEEVDKTLVRAVLKEAGIAEDTKKEKGESEHTKHACRQ